MGIELRTVLLLVLLAVLSVNRFFWGDTVTGVLKIIICAVFGGWYIWDLLHTVKDKSETDRPDRDRSEWDPFQK